MYAAFVKRCLDIIGAIAGIIVSAPLLLIIAALIRAVMGKPVLFRQQRPGLNGKLFTLMKFRTMVEKREQGNKPLSDHDRIVPLGRLLRRTSLDELPQLWNILKGNQSFIGPRPLLKEYLPYYNPEEGRRHEVRPGLTGWAQIHGRNILPFDERLMLDVWYVDHLSWRLDLRILLSTIRIVFTSKGTDPVLFPPLHEQRRRAVMASTASDE
jgi:sugar transferase EpsL